MSEVLSKEEKLRILKTLEEDIEFRYAIAGMVGVLEILKRLDGIETQIAKHSRILEEHSKRLEELTKRVEEMGKRLEEHSKRLEEHSKILSEVVLTIKEHGARIDELNRRVSNLELAVGTLTEATYARYLYEDIAREVALKGESIVRRIRNARVDEEDVDLLIETDATVYVVEIKTRPKHEDVNRTVVKVDTVRKHYPQKKVIGVLAGSLIGREVEVYAREKNILTYTY